MLSAFGRVIKTADLRRKLLFTLGMIVLYRMGTFIPAPGISYGTVQQCLNANQTHGGAYGKHYYSAVARGHSSFPRATR